MCLKSDYVRNGGCFQETPQKKSGALFFVMASLALVLTSSGCMMSSISESADSFSTISKSISNSSSSSSDDEKESYLRDIRQYTVVYTRSNTDIKGFYRGLTTISQKYGVTDWEAYTATYLGIGQGLAKAAFSEQQLDYFSSFLAAGDEVKIAAIRLGFSQGR